MTSTKQAQIKVNLPPQLKNYVDSRAEQFGYTTANYVKHLILRDAQSIEYQYLHDLNQETKMSSKHTSYIKKLDKLAEEISKHQNDPIPNKYIAGVAHSAEELIAQLENDN